MPITPDTKDWTWVVERACPECGFEAESVPLDGIGDLVRDTVRRWETVLGDGSGLDQRPDDSTWAPIEYACHVRDVFRIYDQRLARMLSEDDPLFENWDQDATAVEDRYLDQEPTVVAAELAHAGHSVAAAFDGVQGDQWDRPGRRSDGASFTVATFARYFVHDPVHHLWDVS
ncbi:MAG TPA: DinB family protein [Acidimicrobiales bacterium]|nr:DinB family protein [Acidimicrobiales bacterium]